MRAATMCGAMWRNTSFYARFGVLRYFSIGTPTLLPHSVQLPS